MTRELYSLNDHRATAKQPRGTTADDMATWPNSVTFTTAPLPVADPVAGPASATVPLVFEVTNRLTAAQRSYTSSGRFVGPNGVRLGHFRANTHLASTAHRIFVGGVFEVGKPITITYYWGKTGQTQPGVGFPSATDVLANFRLFLLFENGAAKDFSAGPATFTTVGAPTYVNGRNGQALSCGSGNYIQTTAAKLRSEARDQRHVMALINTPTGDSAGRTVCWADWLNNQRAFQLFSAENYVELYIDQDGISPYQRWTNEAAFLSGWSWIGASWVGGAEDAIVQRDGNVEIANRNPAVPAQTSIHNSTSPYIVGGTPVSGFYHAGLVEAVLEMKTPLTTDQMAAYYFAWKENSTFLGIDQTPNAFSFPSLSSQDTGTEVVFAKAQISGMTAGTSVSISGNGSPSYAISSSSTANDDVVAKTNVASTIDPGQWIRVWHTTAATNSATQRSILTVGDVSVEFTSSTKAAAGTGGGSGIPTGAATYTATSLSQALSIANTQLQPGQILEIIAGDYRNQGEFYLNGRDWSGGAKAVIRSSTRGYRGPAVAEGGTFLDNEGSWTTGSGGAEFSRFNLRGVKNLVLDGLRQYRGVPSTPDKYDKEYASDIHGCEDLEFHYSKFCGVKIDPYASHSALRYAYDANNPWKKMPRGLNIGSLLKNKRITFKKCLFHCMGFMQLFLANVDNALLEDCVFMDSNSDHLRTDGPQTGAIFRRCIFYRVFPQKSSSGSMPHCDVAQNTAKEQPCGYRHTFDMCLFAPGDGNYAHIQGPFYEADLYPTYPAGDYLTIRDCVVESRVTNAIYMRPGNHLLVERTSIIQNQYGGWYENSAGTLIRGDALIHTPQVLVSQTTGNGKSFGNNILKDSIYLAHDFSTGLGDQITNSTQLLASGYATHLFDYPLYGGTFRACKVVNDRGVIVPAELKRMAPKTTSPYHPANRGGANYGGTALFSYYGALP